MILLTHGESLFTIQIQGGVLMKDFSSYTVNDKVFFSGAEKKEEIIIDGFRYIMKYQKNSEIGLVYNHVSEYMGSHVFSILGMPVQETFLGTYNGKEVVLLKNFCKEDEKLIHFNDVGESTLEQDKELYQYTYEAIQQMLTDNSKLTNVNETIEHFWDMFIVDALNGNFDRHGGNWGFLKKENKYKLAPVYDNGSCMYPRLNTDEQLLSVMESEQEIKKRIYQFPTSQIKFHNRKSSYYDIINSLQFESCNQALVRMVERVDLNKINHMIEEIEGITEIRKEFYKTMYQRRFEGILLASYKKLRG